MSEQENKEASFKRYRYGRMAPMIDLPDCELAERVAYEAEVLFCFTEAGMPWDQALATKHLVPGRIYRASHIEVFSMYSRILLEEFPGVWFNTVLFAAVKG